MKDKEIQFDNAVGFSFVKSGFELIVYGKSYEDVKKLVDLLLTKELIKKEEL